MVGDNIKVMIEKIRRERFIGLTDDDHKRTNSIEQITSKDNPLNENKELFSQSKRLTFNEAIKVIQENKIEGKNKILLRIDDKHVKLLAHIKSTLKIDTTKFLNFLVEEFINRHPELKTVIKTSLKNSLKDL